MKKIILLTLLALLLTNYCMARQAEPLSALTEMKIKEITVFKDGHVFVLHNGVMPVNSSGKVVMDYLPTPVLGTYWPFSVDKDVELKATIAGKRKVVVEKTALTIREMIEANVGKKVQITERPFSSGVEDAPQCYEATISEIPTRSGEELEAFAPSLSDEHLPMKGNIVMLKTANRSKALDFSRILDVTFIGQRRNKISVEEFRNLLTLDFKWKDKPKSEIEVGMIYLQKGIRWIPSYKISINSKGRAIVKLEATLLNELTDINDVTVNLVIGVPSFAFKKSIDPISLRKDVAQLSSNFRNDSQTAYGFSNSIMSQQTLASSNNRRQNTANVSNPIPELSGGQKSEDLYMFAVKHVSLRKGECLVMPIAEYEVSYEDIYSLDIPFAPPQEIMRNLGHSRIANLRRSSALPKVKHKIRISNKSNQPFTTAPAMIMKDGRILAQGLMTYTPIGGDADIELTTAVDISVAKTDNEVKRTPNAVTWNKDRYTKIALEGKVKLTNYKAEKVTIEVTRYVLGNIDLVGQKGKKDMVNPFEDNSFMPARKTSAWWHNYSWPWWWYRFNGIGRLKWTITLEATKAIELKYGWHYFWR